MALFQSIGLGSNPPSQRTPQTPSRTRKILRYSTMPEILPRIRALGFHFGHFAYLLALVFGSARLIPHNHPAMSAANIGRFGVRQVIAIAANNITWDRKHIDQIGIFSAIIIGLVAIAIQAILIALYALSGGEAMASDDPSSFFAIPSESQDLSLVLFSQVFGDLGGFWGDGIAAPGAKSEIHTAIHEMLKLYSMATMVIAVIIVLYYILTVIGEAAKTGTPFGQRFNSLWAPIRLVVALGLLVPLASGLNSAQYITLWTAKMATGLGAQVWKIMATELIQDKTTYFVEDSNAAWVGGLTNNIFLSEVCAQLFNKHNAGVNPITSDFRQNTVSGSGDMTYIRFWRSDDPALDGKCGSVSLSMKGQKEQTETSTTVFIVNKEIVPTEQLFNASSGAVNAIYAAVKPLAEQYANANIAPKGGEDNLLTIRQSLQSIAEGQKTALEGTITSIYSDNIEIQFDEILQENINRGWLTAGLWYLKIGQAVQQAESPKYEMIPTSTTAAAADSDMPEGQSWWDWMTGTHRDVYDALKAVTDEINKIRPSQVSDAAPSGEETNEESDLCSGGLGYTDDDWFVGIRCTIYTLITPDSLLRLRSEPNLDPMTGLIVAGGEIINRAIMFLTATAIALVAKESGLVDVITSLLNRIPYIGFLVGGLVSAIVNVIVMAAPLIVMISLAGFAAGLILFYLLPLIPFIYFFFGVLSWVLEIIEAVIAMPLWALAHLRIDGDGMPGSTAMNGYHLLLAILLRPPLIIIAMALGYVAFGAGVFLLQHLFDPLIGIVKNDRVYGFDLLVYTIIFSYLCYSIAMVCFKMVDSVPNQILRWLGSGAQTFSDQNPNDPVGSSTGAVIAASAVITSGANSMPDMAKGLGGSIGESGLGQKMGLKGTSQAQATRRGQQQEGWLREAKLREKGIDPETGKSTKGNDGDK